MKNRWLFRPISLILLLFCTVLTGVTAFLDLSVFYAELAVLVLVFIGVILNAQSLHRDVRRVLETVSAGLSPTQRDALEKYPVPALTTDMQGVVLWYNKQTEQQLLTGMPFHGRTMTDLFNTAGWREACRASGLDVTISGKRFTAYGTTVEEQFLFLFVENTELKRKSEEYDASRPSVMLIAIDNFDEVLQSALESDKARYRIETERLLEQFLGQTTGFLCKTDRGRYIAIVEERHMKMLIEAKFPILDQVRDIAGPGQTPLTMSIGVGRAAATLAEGERQARQALDMCLGRGGDQVAIQTAGDYEFFGGIGRGVEKKTKVKTRIVASALHDLIMQADQVVVMGHRFGDLDSLGASVGMARSCRELGRPAVIATDLSTNLAAPLIDRLIEHGYGDYFESPAEVLGTITKKTLLVVVDTHIQSFVESGEIFKRCKQVAVIDHHRKMVGHIDNAVIFYHEPYASSASEMVAELAQYLTDRAVIGRYEAEALLAGIMLDTKNFVLRTGVRTFEAAAYLRRLGADTVEVRKLFASTMESHQKRAKIMSQAEVYKRCAVATWEEMGPDMRIVAPQAADEMLNISDVDASFVLYKTPNEVSLSARSMGAINVQLIAEKLGGGGHQTMAGAQLKDVTVGEARERLIEEIDAFYARRA